MSNSFIRMLKLAEALYNSGDLESLGRLNIQFNAYLKKNAHFEPLNDGTTPNPWRHNMDYAGWENSPYFGSMTEFMEKFPGGIPDWIKWRRETQKQRNLMWSKISERRDGMRQKIAADRVTTVLNKWRNNIKETARIGAVTYINAMSSSSSGLPENKKWKHIKKEINMYLKVLDNYIEEDIKSSNLVAMINSLFKFRRTSKYPKYVKLFNKLTEEIADSASASFFNYLEQIIKAPIQTAEDKPLWPDPELFPDDPEGMFESSPLEPEETESSQKLPTEEERAKAKQLIEELLGLVTKEEAEALLKESTSNVVVVEAKFVPVGPDDTKKFPKEPHLWSDEGFTKFKSVTDYLKKYRGHSQEADDLGSAALKAIQDFIDYWKLLSRAKKRRSKKHKSKGKK